MLWNSIRLTLSRRSAILPSRQSSGSSCQTLLQHIKQRQDVLEVLEFVLSLENLTFKPSGRQAYKRYATTMAMKSQKTHIHFTGGLNPDDHCAQAYSQ